MDIAGMLAYILAALSAVNPPPSGSWAQTLTQLDDRRSQAFSRADVTLLRGVYAGASSLRDADAATVRAYARRGWQVEGVRFRLIDVEVIAERDRTVTLGVVDQLQPVRVRKAGHPWTILPRDQATQRRIVLTRSRAGWRISEVTRVAG